MAGEADLVVPNFAGTESFNLLLIGIGIAFVGCVFGFVEYLL